MYPALAPERTVKIFDADRNHVPGSHTIRYGDLDELLLVPNRPCERIGVRDTAPGALYGLVRFVARRRNRPPERDPHGLRLSGHRLKTA